MKTTVFNAVFLICLPCSTITVEAAFSRPVLHGHHQQTFLQPGLLAINKPSSGQAGPNSTRLSAVGSAGHPHHVNAELACGQTHQVGAHTDKYEDCPASCPYFAQNRKDTAHCTFVCVPGAECGRWNPNKPIPDTIKNSKTCRGPRVAFCKEPDLGGVDTCLGCQSGFNLFEGHCYFKYWTQLIIFAVLVLIFLIVVIVWFVDFCCREGINDEEVKRAQAFRSRSKVMMPRSLSPDGKRRVWPIETNLCKTDVAGLGMMLHFNFQAAMILWPLLVAITWTVLACFHNELFILGTRKFGTPRHNCVLVAWGYETQQRLMWTKFLFLLIVYVFSFVYFLLFSVRQFRLYQDMNAKEMTMQDFCVELKGLPALPADASVEKDILTAVEAATQQRAKVIGVSVAWNFQDYEDDIFQAVKDDQSEREQGERPPEELDYIPDPTEKMGPIRTKLYNAEKSVLFGDGLEENPREKEHKLVQILNGLTSSESAFVVFDTEQDKETALQATQGTSFQFDATKYGKGKCELTLERVSTEPATINWQNFGDSSFPAMLKRFIWGFCVVYLPALAVWFFVFYVPYAWSLYNFNYDNGAQLPGYYSIIFTIIVVGGNATMYVVCDICCDVIGFRYKDTKQMTYMLMYLFACMFNVLLDMLVTYFTALKVMIGLDFRTHDGTRLEDIVTWTEQFETYAMQRSLAENVYTYAFPSTFLIPFLIEPIITVLIPYQIGRLIIRSHSEIKGPMAESYLAAFDFDMGRYADILLNVFLGILIFFFPGGYTWSLFYGMFISHIVIYIFDHWRVLNVIPSVKIVSTFVDWWAQVMLAACCSLILSCLIFKGNCETYTGYCLQDFTLVGSCTLAAFVHFIVHMLLLVYLVPRLGKDPEDENQGMKFSDVAENEANTWFSVNPVHCLRSKHIHKDKPHCRFSSTGKEHLLEVNERINCYFSDDAADVEEYGKVDVEALKSEFSALRKSFIGGN